MLDITRPDTQQLDGMLQSVRAMLIDRDTINNHIYCSHNTAEFKKRHNRVVLDALQYRKMIPPWDAVEAQLKKGPPPFLRPGWRSPLLGRRVNLDWIDQDSFICLQGSREGWRNKKVLIIEFWAS